MTNKRYLATKIGSATLLLFFSALLLIGCSARLVPAPPAQIVPGDKTAAVAEIAGVRMVVAAGRWSGSPADLEDVVTPLRVRIENGSSEPLRIQYKEFALVSRAGFSVTALPPYEIKGRVVKRMFLPEFYHSGFYVAPH